jgi:putative ABC transport system substrate-binding protein
MQSMTGKILIWLLATILLTTALPAQGQQARTIPRIGFVSGRSSPTRANPDSNSEAFRQGLRDYGYVVGKNIVVDYRYLEGKDDRIPSLLAELVLLKADVLVSPALQVIRAAKQATTTIPIVMVTNADPVAAGLVDSLAHPGGNVTGLTRLNIELRGKRLELLKEAVPGISRVGVLSSADSTAFKDYDAAARVLKIALVSLKVPASNPNLESAFRDAVKGRVTGLISTTSTVLLPYSKKIADLAIKNQLPLVFERSDDVEAGGLLSYSTNDLDQFRRAAYYVDKILKGAKPADLPVEQPTKFELVINLKAAKQIGLTIPPNVLARADKVIK